MREWIEKLRYLLFSMQIVLNCASSMGTFGKEEEQSHKEEEMMMRRLLLEVIGIARPIDS